MRNHRFPLRGLGDTAPDYSPSWYDIVGTMRKIGPALTAAQANLTTALQAAVAADYAADPDGFSTTNADQVYGLLGQVTTTIDQFNSLAGALNTFSSLFPSGPIQLASLRGVLPDTIGGWSLPMVIAFFSPISGLLAGAVALYQSMTGASAPGGGIVSTVQTSIANTNAAINSAIQSLGQAPAQIGTAAVKWLAIGAVVFLLGDQMLHKKGFV